MSTTQSANFGANAADWFDEYEEPTPAWDLDDFDIGADLTALQSARAMADELNG